MTTLVIKDESELIGVAAALLPLCDTHGGAAVLALKGDLGAGKTALTKAIAQNLGVEEHVTSPTFVIMKSYALTGHAQFHTLIHIDAYRVEDERELVVLGFPTLLSDPHTLVVIEWPERIAGLLPLRTVVVSLAIGSHNERIITYGA